MMNAAARLGGRYAAPAFATGSILALTVAPELAHAKEAKADVSKLVDISVDSGSDVFSWSSRFDLQFYDLLIIVSSFLSIHFRRCKEIYRGID